MARAKRQYTVEVTERSTGRISSYTTWAVSAKEAEAHAHHRLVKEFKIDRYLSLEERHERFIFETFLTKAMPDRKALPSALRPVQLDLPEMTQHQELASRHGMFL